MAVIDLSQLLPPQIVDVPDFETLLAERKAEFVALHPKDEREAVIRTLERWNLGQSPNCCRRTLTVSCFCASALTKPRRAVMVAYSGGDDLDNLGANNNVQRRVITAADDTTTPPTEAVMESDADYRQRIPAAFEGMSVAGPVGAYEYHALSSDGRVADASAFSPSPAEVVVTILARDGDGTAPEDLLQVVGEALNDEAVRPVADRVSVRSAEIVPYEIDAVLYVYPGPAKEPILAAAKAQGTAYINEQRRLGRDVRLSAIYAALHVQGVQRVELIKPLTDMVLDKTQASYCTDFKAEIGGSDD
ncbi:baseplate J/gp47 family protein [Escherichia coli]|nr:baseplate J/gp47 family protein [Escherichia coli]